MEKNDWEWNIVVEEEGYMTTADFLFPPICSITEKPRQPHHVLIEQDLNLPRAVRRFPIKTDIPIHTFIAKIMEDMEAELERRRKELERRRKEAEEEAKRRKEEEEENRRKEEEEKKKRGETENIISKLPDTLLKEIISYLPIKEQARSGILSHRWNPVCSQLWASNPILHLSWDERLICRVQRHGNLKTIRLDHLELDKDHIDALLSDASTPLLEALMVDQCTFLYGPVYLSHPEINKLHITSCAVRALHRFFIAELPELESLRYNHTDNPPLLLQPATSLVEASLCNDHDCLWETERYLYSMRFMPHLRRLTITFEMFHCLVVGDPKHSKYSFEDSEELFVGEFENLEELHLENGTVTDAFCIALVTFINGNPSIQKLCLKVDIATTTSWDRYRRHYYNLDGYPHLDASPPFPNRQPFPLLMQLKKFRIMCSKGKSGEIRLARLILEHAVALESFNVICWCRGKNGTHTPSFHEEDFIRSWQWIDNNLPPEIQNYSCYWERLQAEMDDNKHSDCQKGATVPVIVTHRNIICPLHYDIDD